MPYEGAITRGVLNMCGVGGRLTDPCWSLHRPVSEGMIADTQLPKVVEAHKVIIDSEGYARVPEKPGLGMKIDWDSIDGWTITIL